ncbi:hypothetical protein OF83DRAFT_1088432, partial [Amylostereum chailletii]
MHKGGLGWILGELAGDRQVKTRADDAMDVDGQAQGAVPKKATTAPGSVVQSKKMVDLESMAFSQGGHLMSNKRMQLPDGSFKRAKRGYEEVHVPAPKQKPTAPLRLATWCPSRTCLYGRGRDSPASRLLTVSRANFTPRRWVQMNQFS